MNITYKKGYKYQTTKRLRVDVGIRGKDIDTDYLLLESNGHMCIKKGYAWDGPSGPTVDTKNFMRGSLVHDALYQLIREGHLPREAREQADKLLREHCREDGMSRLRAWWVFVALRWFGDPAANPSNKKRTLTAP